MFVATIFGAFLILAAIGIPLSLALVAGTALPIALFTTTNLQVIVQRFFNAVNQYSLMAIPLFVISGALLDKGGVSKRLVRFANSLVGWMPGGLAIVAFLASAFFGAISGSSLATVAAIGAIVVPSMLDEGYPLRIGEAVTVGHGAILHGCSIGDNSLIGMGAIVLNGASIGKNCIIGAGALVTQGTVIPDGMLALGSPAKVKRPLTSEEIRENRQSALDYIDCAKKHFG